MPVAAFEPKFMKIGVLTAALQELTPRSVRDGDPDRAIEEWAGFAREVGADYMQLSAALHPTEADVPAEAMLDPVANTLDLRQPFGKDRAKRVQKALDASRIGLSDLAYFDNMLHEDAAVRKKKHGFMRRVFEAASLLGVDAVCGFVGRNQKLSMDQNLLDFEESFVPLLKEAKTRALVYRIEQCPMPGWTTGDSFHNQIAYTPGTWIALHRICEKHGVGEQFRIHYDPSHAVLMGQDTRSIFQYLKDEGYGFLIGGFHVKGQVVDAQGVAAWGYGGQTIQRGDWVEGTLSCAGYLRKVWGGKIYLEKDALTPGGRKVGRLDVAEDRVTVDFGVFTTGLQFEDPEKLRTALRREGLRDGSYAETDCDVYVKVSRHGSKKDVLREKPMKQVFPAKAHESRYHG